MRAPVQRPVERKPGRVGAGLYALEVPHATFADYRQIEGAEQVGLARTVFATKQYSAARIEVPKFQRMLAVKRAEILDGERVDVNLSHVISPHSPLAAPSHP